MKSGTVAIIGRPNVGKSTLLNALLGEKIAIISDTPQTTRTRILGVLHREDAQIVLLDTPGLHKPEYQLNRRMVRTALGTMEGADLLYVMVEGTAAPGAGDRFVIQRVREAAGSGECPAFLLINKVDLVSKPRLLPLIASYSQMLRWTEVVPLSAKTGLNVDRLVDLTVAVLPEGDALYGEDVITDQPMRTLAAGRSFRSTRRSSNERPDRSERVRSSAKRYWNASSLYAWPSRLFRATPHAHRSDTALSLVTEAVAG